MRTIAPAQSASFTAFSGAAARLRRAAAWALGALLHWALETRERMRQREALAKLDDHLLKDIGLMRWQVEQEDVQQVIDKLNWPS